MAGPNGAGKTTLLNMLIGKLEPDEGAVRLGANLEIASLEQSRDSLKPDWTVADALTGGSGDLVVINGAARHVASYMQDFLFQPEQVRTPVKVLSGGERARLMLARALAKPSNLLVLDEPTNDLDLETLDVLEEMLSDYSGTLDPHQPRPRFSRPHRDVDHRSRGRRPLDRICGRLYRHGRATGRTHVRGGRSGQSREAIRRRSQRERATRRRAEGKEAAQLQGEARPRNPAGQRSPAWKRRSPHFRRSSRIPRFTPKTARRSSKQALHLSRRKTSWLRRNTAGWSLKFCARR